MNTATESIDEPRISASTLRVRRHRERRREGLRLLTLEMPEPAIETAVALGLLKPEDWAQSSSVIKACMPPSFQTGRWNRLSPTMR
jgi:hypothetical protein